MELWILTAKVSGVVDLGETSVELRALSYHSAFSRRAALNSGNRHARAVDGSWAVRWTGVLAQQYAIAGGLLALGVMLWCVTANAAKLFSGHKSAPPRCATTRGRPKVPSPSDFAILRSTLPEHQSQLPAHCSFDEWARTGCERRVAAWDRG